MIGRLEQLCQAQGVRLNNKRRVIVDVIESAGGHPCVEDLYNRVIARDSKISMATVYRTVNILTDAGLLQRLELGDGKTRFEEAGGEHHEHLVDVQSGQVVEFREPQIEALVRSAAERLGYHLVGYRLELFANNGSAQAPAPWPPIRRKRRGGGGVS